MTRKRFKKLLMGRYKFSRNQAENISRWGDYTIEECKNGTKIAHKIFILGNNVKFIQALESQLDKIAKSVTTTISMRWENDRQGVQQEDDVIQP